MLKQLLLFTVTAVTIPVCAQKTDYNKKYGALIDSVDLRKHLSVLASDAYEGRETGKKGQQMAAQYLLNAFKESGCSMAPGMSSYEQFFDVIETEPAGRLTFGAKALTFKTDFVYYGAKRELVLSNLDLHTLESWKKSGTTIGAIIHRIKGVDVRAELDELKKNMPANANVRAYVLVTSNYADLYEYLEHYTTNKTMRLKDEPASSGLVKAEVPVIVVNAASLEDIIRKPFRHLIKEEKEKPLKNGNPVAVLSGTLNHEVGVLTSSNVLAYIPGSDPILAKEVVVVTAHYDHIGIVDGVVYNGADDDGTGTVALLEIAQAFATAKKQGHAPRRSLLIMAVSGEEKGLLGSAYYASHPIIPLEKTITDLNIDMIGRNDIAHETMSDYVYIIGSNMLSTDLHKANEKANDKYTKLTLDYKFNTKTDPNQFYYRSDHYNFAKFNIPSIFYFSGIHDDYHQPTDDIEKINFQKVEKIARLVFSTAWILANETDRPRLDY